MLVAFTSLLLARVPAPHYAHGHAPHAHAGHVRAPAPQPHQQLERRRDGYADGFKYVLPPYEDAKIQSKMFDANPHKEWLRGHKAARYLHPATWAALTHPGHSAPEAWYGLRSPMELGSMSRRDIMNTRTKAPQLAIVPGG